MSSVSLPKVLVLGHSFVKRLRFDINRGNIFRSSSDLGLAGHAFVSMFGVGGLTIPRLWKDHLRVVSRRAPDVIILELGTNDLSREEPELVASSLEVLVRLLHDRFKVKVICVCLVVPRLSNDVFNAKMATFNELVQALFEPLPFVFCWRHRGFYGDNRPLSLHDGVHVTPVGQYRLYRSYRGAILRALTLI